jgi:hypothetical protein
MTETDRQTDAAGAEAKQARSLSRLQLVLAVLAVVAAGAAGVQIGLWLRGTPESAEPELDGQMPLPEAGPIWAAWRAAEKGDVAAYMECFTGPARAELERELEEMGEDALAQRLKQDVNRSSGLMIEPLEDPKAGLGFRVAIGRAEETELYDYLVARGEDGWAVRKIVPRGTRPGAMETPGLPPPAKQGDTP